MFCATECVSCRRLLAVLSLLLDSASSRRVGDAGNHPNLPLPITRSAPNICSISSAILWRADVIGFSIRQRVGLQHRL